MYKAMLQNGTNADDPHSIYDHKRARGRFAPVDEIFDRCDRMACKIGPQLEKPTEVDAA